MMKKWLTTLLLVHAACILQVYSFQSTEVEDAPLQQLGNQLEAANTTAVDGSDALAQLDLLSLVTRYAGLGYNIIRGNPEGDFNRGGIDPGIKTTRVIFAHTYQLRKEAIYQGKTMEVPDQVNFHMSQSCASSHSVNAFSGRKSYMKELGTSVSVGGT